MRALLATLLSSVLLAVPTATPAHADEAPQTAYVAVNVATLWTNPGKARPVDQPALTNPAHPRKWINGMTDDERADLTDSNRTQTQALLGEKVLVLAQQDGWSQVVVPDQPTPRDARGYPGWVPTVQLTRDPSYAAAVTSHPFALVDTGITTGLFKDRRLQHRTLKVSMNTRLPVLRRTGKALLVAVPDQGRAWLPRNRAHVYKSESAIPTPTGRQLVRTAKTFLRQPYVWAGRGGWGFDCSGLTGLVYQAHGITIPRDSGPQSQDPRARRVAVGDLKPGDLLFYSKTADPKSIYHVAMYAGHGKMVEAYDHLTPVRVTPARLGENYWGAVRYLR